MTESTELAREWADGRRSHLNTFIGLHGDRAWELAMCAVADAAEVVKHAVVAGLDALDRCIAIAKDRDL